MNRSEDLLERNKTMGRYVYALMVAVLCLGCLAGCMSSPSKNQNVEVSYDWNQISGKTWTLISMKNRPVIKDTQITLQFFEDGKLAGHGGVNRYFGGYQRSGESGLAISKIGSTRMFREYPEGIMDQEIRYLSALETTTHYQLVNKHLELVTDGFVVMQFAGLD